MKLVIEQQSDSTRWFVRVVIEDPEIGPRDIEDIRVILQMTILDLPKNIKDIVVAEIPRRRSTD